MHLRQMGMRLALSRVTPHTRHGAGSTTEVSASAMPRSPELNVLHASLTRLKNCQGIERRPGAAFDRERREGHHELVTLQAARGFDGPLEVEILDNRDAHPVEHRLVNGIDGNVLRFAPAWTR